jgi:hypothetical protein
VGAHLLVRVSDGCRQRHRHLDLCQAGCVVVEVAVDGTERVHGVALDQSRSDLPRHRDRLLGPASRLVEVTCGREPAGEAGKHAGTLDRRR